MQSALISLGVTVKNVCSITVVHMVTGRLISARPSSIRRLRSYYCKQRLSYNRGTYVYRPRNHKPAFRYTQGALISLWLLQ
jgi:hypothetical protein